MKRPENLINNLPGSLMTIGLYFFTMRLEVYDLECLANLFTYTGFDVQTKTWYQYVIHQSRNDIKELYEHLMTDKSLYMVGYNNESYDYPLLHHLLNHYDVYQNTNGQEISQRLYSKSQEIIDQEFSTIADKNKFIKQIDLYKLWHYNNPSKATS